MSERGNPSVVSMAMSILCMGAIVLGVYAIGWLFYGNEPDERSVDHEPTLVEARRAAEFAVFAPATLPDGWRANHVDFTPLEGGTWRLGVLTADDDYIGLEQTPLSFDAAVARYAPEAEPTSKAQVGGFEWEVWKRPNGEPAYVRTAEDHTVLVTGSADQDIIEAYIASLVSE